MSAIERPLAADQASSDWHTAAGQEPSLRCTSIDPHDWPCVCGADVPEDCGLLKQKNYIAQERAYFGLCWPRACKKCRGAGYHEWKEAHGEYLREPCECVLGSADNEGRPVCPRCGYQLFFGMDQVGEGPCENCEWDYDEGIPTL